MSLPDQSHINHVRDLLWQKRGCGASVMVGAGFSRNASPVGASAREFPLWHQVAQKLCSKLYPPHDESRLKDALADASSTSGFLRLAQEYEIAFGRGSLHTFIKDAVPDLDYSPSNLHISLLELPWRDVLTTNWDTLLERTRISIPERSYSVVRTVEEISSTSSPRIIKLHGSLPAHTPFIFTEEDYRTYPRRFSPFVNTVQQAMMESVLILIGFSGDDPNFLQWSGWVRDNLGESSPKIYLSGWLNLSPHRRRMLEDRNVVPIDLAKHPQASSWPDHLRHQYATEWIIKSLREGQSYNFKNWPLPPKNLITQYPEYLLPVEKSTQSLPLAVPSLPKTIDTGQIENLVKIWSHNRTLYPNWLFLPPNLFYRLEYSLRDWLSPILSSLENLRPDVQIKALRELVWQFEILLLPLPTEIDKFATMLFEHIDCQNRTTNTLELTNPNWTELRESDIAISLSSLTAARLDLNTEKFNKILAKLTQYQNQYPDLTHSLAYEKCLWSLYNLDFPSLEKQIDAWKLNSCDPIWMFRKAAILVELHEEEDAKKLVSLGLLTIRDSTNTSNNFANASREGWGLLLAQAFKDGFNSKLKNSEEFEFDFWERRDYLAQIHCDAVAQKNDLIDKINEIEVEKEINPTFDIFLQRGETIRFNNSKYESFVGVYRGIRLCEISALPPLVSQVVIGSVVLKASLKNLAKLDLNLALRLVLRLKPTDDDKVINPIYSRTNIALAPEEDVYKLADQILVLLQYSLSKLASKNTFWISYVRTCLEALSRLVIRFNSEKATNLLRTACNLYINPNISNHVWLAGSMNNLLARSWEALPLSAKNELALVVLNLPISGLNGYSNSHQHLDAGVIIRDNKAKIKLVRTPENKHIWRAIIQQIIAGLDASGTARHYASSRLVTISPYLTDVEKQQASNALWGSQFATSAALPTDTGLFDWAFYLLPEPRADIADQNFRLKYLSNSLDIDLDSSFEQFDKLAKSYSALNPNTPVTLNEEDRVIYSTIDSHAGICKALNEIAGAINWHKKVGKVFFRSDVEKNNVILLISKWFETTEPSKLKSGDPGRLLNTIDSEISNIINDLNKIIPFLYLTEELSSQIFEKLKSLNHAGIYDYRLLGCLSKFKPALIPEMNTFLRKGLVSENNKIADAAMCGLQYWIYLSLKENFEIPTPSEDLIREVGLAVATRRKASLIYALMAAEHIFSAPDVEPKNILTPLILEGLEYLKEELAYDREHDDPQIIPISRVFCAKLALIMSQDSIDHDQIIKDWIETAKSDPLPEVRRAVEITL